jgi:hypothetical protein
MAFYSHVARDLEGCAEAVTHADDGVQALHAEADYGANLFRDLTQAYYDLALMPFTAMAGILAAQAEPQKTEPAKTVRA